MDSVVDAMKNSERHGRHKAGRPLSFDRDAALHQAMLLFWRHGYEATSLNDLTAAMGVTPPSIYAAFGDKKGLFLEAVRRYLASAPPQRATGKADTARAMAHDLLRGAALRYTGEDTPAGCLVASAAISCSAAAADVKAELSAIRRDTEALLRARIIGATDAGELPAGTDAEALAAHVMAVVQGLSTMARDGASRKKLMRVVDVAMTAWPASPGESGMRGSDVPLGK